LRTTSCNPRAPSSLKPWVGVLPAGEEAPELLRGHGLDLAAETLERVAVDGARAGGARTKLVRRRCGSARRAFALELDEQLGFLRRRVEIGRSLRGDPCKTPSGLAWRRRRRPVALEVTRSAARAPRATRSSRAPSFGSVTYPIH
jgi:hypothetical protein